VVGLRVFLQTMEVLRARIEQQLQATSGLSYADYSVLAVLSEAPAGRIRPYEFSRIAGREKCRLFVNCLSPDQIDQLADTSSIILGNLQADQPPL
jgi:hypothetical protein